MLSWLSATVSFGYILKFLHAIKSFFVSKLRWYKVFYTLTTQLLYKRVVPNSPFRYVKEMRYADTFHITMTSYWARWRLKSLASRLFTQPFIHGAEKTPKPRVTGLYEGNSSVTGEFPAQRDSYAENVSIWWRHHDTNKVMCVWSRSKVGKGMAPVVIGGQL